MNRCWNYLKTSLINNKSHRNFFVMSKNKSKKSSSKKPESLPTAAPNLESTFPITLDKSNFVILQIHAKPGAKQNAITGITTEGLEVQINAPPTEGAANTELVKYIASVVGVSKGNVSFERGHKSRSKTLKITDSVSVETVKKKIMDEIESR